MQEIRSSNPPVVTGFVIQINLEHDTITVKNSSPRAFPVGFLMFLHFSVLDRSWWFFMESICKSVLLMLVYWCLVQLSSCSILAIFLILPSVILLSMLMILLSTLRLGFGFVGLLELAFELESDKRDTMCWRRKWPVIQIKSTCYIFLSF